MGNIRTMYQTFDKWLDIWDIYSIHKTQQQKDNTIKTYQTFDKGWIFEIFIAFAKLSNNKNKPPSKTWEKRWLDISPKKTKVVNSHIKIAIADYQGNINQNNNEILQHTTENGL